MTTETFTRTHQYVVVNCYTCGTPFGLDTEYDSLRRNDHESFYCPNGHPQAYVGKSASERKIDELTKSLETTRTQKEFWTKEARRSDVKRERAERSAAAVKGHMTRMRNRVARGICPQAGCKRSFTSLHDHVATCHPHLIEQAGLEQS